MVLAEIGRGMAFIRVCWLSILKNLNFQNNNTMCLALEWQDLRCIWCNSDSSKADEAHGRCGVGVLVFSTEKFAHAEKPLIKTAAHDCCSELMGIGFHRESRACEAIWRQSNDSVWFKGGSLMESGICWQFGKSWSRQELHMVIINDTILVVRRDNHV